MRKNGFAFIETIITVVILSTSLLYLYNSYTTIISNEETKIYYDDPAYIYKTNYVKKFLEEYSEIEKLKDNFNGYYFEIRKDLLFNETQIAEGMRETYDIINNIFKINQMYMIKSSFFTECNLADINSNSTICKNSINDLNYGIRTYMKTLNDPSYDYYLVVEYTEKYDADNNLIKCVPEIDTYCTSYYVSLGI